MNKADIRELTRRYFEADLSLEEERMLLRLLMAEPELGQEESEALAAMSLARVVSRPSPAGRVRRFGWYAAAAVVAVAFAGVAWMALSDSHGSTDGGVAVAYVDGVRIDSREEIMSIVAQQLDDIGVASRQLGMEVSGDLDDLGEALKMEEL